mmetsp:Transcript_110945/g.192325  ORF Transcript_110945/g.192325 Transcript_110945/m.192325 type:complete len:323 (-) Transcript_110945:57-1025(-)
MTSAPTIHTTQCPYYPLHSPPSKSLAPHRSHPQNGHHLRQPLALAPVGSLPQRQRVRHPPVDNVLVQYVRQPLKLGGGGGRPQVVAVGDIFADGLQAPQVVPVKRRQPVADVDVGQHCCHHKAREGNLGGRVHEDHSAVVGVIQHGPGRRRKVPHLQPMNGTVVEELLHGVEGVADHQVEGQGLQEEVLRLHDLLHAVREVPGGVLPHDQLPVHVVHVLDLRGQHQGRRHHELRVTLAHHTLQQVEPLEVHAGGGRHAEAELEGLGQADDAVRVVEVQQLILLLREKLALREAREAAAWVLRGEEPVLVVGGRPKVPRHGRA